MFVSQKYVFKTFSTFIIDNIMKMNEHKIREMCNDRQIAVFYTMEQIYILV